MMKLYVDDVRECPDGWLCARTVADAKIMLARTDIEEVSLDHDMGACEACTAAGEHVGDQLTPETTFVFTCKHAETGYDLVMWMIENGHLPPAIRVHSMNPCGRDRMVAAFRNHFERQG